MTDPLGLISSAGNASQAAQGAGARRTQEAAGPNFKDVLMQQIGEVDKLQKEAEMAVEDLVSGARNDANNVFMAKQKADIAFQMLLQVRNKMMDAYEEVKQIRV